MVEPRVLALALAYPGWGPDRLSLELGREKWGGLQRDLVRELHIYNTDRAHQGRRAQGRTPEQTLTDPKLWL